MGHDRSRRRRNRTNRKELPIGAMDVEMLWPESHPVVAEQDRNPGRLHLRTTAVGAAAALTIAAAFVSLSVGSVAPRIDPEHASHVVDQVVENHPETSGHNPIAVDPIAVDPIAADPIAANPIAANTASRDTTRRFGELWLRKSACGGQEHAWGMVDVWGECVDGVLSFPTPRCTDYFCPARSGDVGGFVADPSDFGPMP